MKTATPSNLMTNLLAKLDLDDFADVSTGTLVLRNPKTGEATTSEITLASPEHECRKRIDLSRARKLRVEYAANGKLEATDPLDEIAQQTEYLVAATLGWNLTQGGQELPFSPEAARILYTDPKKQWLRAQVLEGLNKTALFIEGSAKA